MQRSIRNELRRLPYREMRQLSHDLADRMGVDPHNETVIADALTSLPTDAEYDEVEKRRREILAGIFRRKLQITIQPHDSGFLLAFPSSGVSVVSDDIEEGMHQLFQTVISYEALK